MRHSVNVGSQLQWHVPWAAENTNHDGRSSTLQEEEWSEVVTVPEHVPGGAEVGELEIHRSFPHQHLGLLMRAASLRLSDTTAYKTLLPVANRPKSPAYIPRRQVAMYHSASLKERHR